MKMLFLLVIAATVLPSSGINVNGTINNDGVCLCSVVLPDTSFPVEKVEYLEITSQELKSSVEQEISKVQEYSRAVSVHSSKLLNLTRRLEKMETGHSYTQLDFELLKLEIQELETLTNQLRNSLNNSNSIIDQLYAKITNMSRTVSELESFDTQNVLAFRKEIALLRKQLADCEKNQAPPTHAPIEYGSCDHNGILQIGGPTVIQLNYNGFSYKYGGWGKDSIPPPNKKELYWVAPLYTDARTLYSFRVYYSHDDLLLYKNSITETFSSSTYRAQGSGMVLFNNSLYYNCYNSRDMCRYNIDTGSVQRETLRGAAFNNRYSYAGITYQDMDFAVDETGLWIIYCPEANAGNAVIGKINVTTFTVEKTWVTRLFKPSVTNAFMICGVLYAIRPVNPQSEEIFYTFDTRTGQEGRVSIRMGKVLEKLQSVNYNPADHKLYVYNDGYQLTYDVMFRHEPPVSSSVAN
ncbi:olfactomedin-4-like [Rhincodon typus]|uniref:olfactomedin-4-like n=1 Tax=Rhincodon typus TaxID=259920 RepID=UPI00202F83BE|nr:olfactomedin-4-like [Rhincodon typus]